MPQKNNELLRKIHVNIFEWNQENACAAAKRFRNTSKVHSISAQIAGMLLALGQTYTVKSVICAVMPGMRQLYQCAYRALKQMATWTLLTKISLLVSGLAERALQFQTFAT